LRIRDRLCLLELRAIQIFSETQGVTNADQRIGLLFLVGLAALGWLIIIWSMANMSSPLVALTMPKDATWSLSEIIAVWLMWTVMMGAMMLPSAIPMLVVHRRVAARKDPTTKNAHRWFLLGYLVGWTLFSVAAAVAQWGFQEVEILSHMLRLRNPVVAGSIFIAAGFFQFTPIKATCLQKCRTPIGFLLTEWRSGRTGALRMGLSHGKYCIGCCWALMMVLFVGGVMSLTTIATLASIVLLEKLMPRGDLIAKLGGFILILCGVFLLV
jgi:predicted metal-binding membrane protein